MQTASGQDSVSATFISCNHEGPKVWALHQFIFFMTYCNNCSSCLDNSQTQVNQKQKPRNCLFSTFDTQLKSALCWFYFDYFTHYSSMDTKGSQEFIPNFWFTWFDMVQIWNDCMWITNKTIHFPLLSDWNPSGHHLFLSQWISLAAST